MCQTCFANLQTARRHVVTALRKGRCQWTVLPRAGWDSTCVLTLSCTPLVRCTSVDVDVTCAGLRNTLEFVVRAGHRGPGRLCQHVDTVWHGHGNHHRRAVLKCLTPSVVEQGDGSGGGDCEQMSPVDQWVRSGQNRLPTDVEALQGTTHADSQPESRDKMRTELLRCGAIDRRDALCGGNCGTRKSSDFQSMSETSESMSVRSGAGGSVARMEKEIAEFGRNERERGVHLFQCESSLGGGRCRVGTTEYMARHRF